MNKINGFFNLTFTEGKLYFGIWLFTLLLVSTSFLDNESLSAGLNLILSLIVVFLIWGDINQLRSKGINPPSRWWVLIPVVYMFRRDKATNKPNYRLAWVFFLLVVIVTTISVIATDFTGERSDFPVNSCRLVDTMGAVKQAQLSCVKVSDVEKVADHWYRGQVLLSNGTTHTIMGQYKGENNGYLEVTLQ